jgi:pentatricopeptide repeat protein
MQQEDIAPDAVVFSNVLKACGYLEALEQGRLVHEQIRRSTTATETALGIDLVEFYGRCRSLKEAHHVFDKVPKRNVMFWAALISAYAGYGVEGTAFQLYERMKGEGIDPNMPIFLSVIKDCGNLGSMIPGRLIHDQILRYEYDKDSILSTGMIDMYMNCGSLDEAHRVFRGLRNQDVVSWSALISGYVEHDDTVQVGKLYKEMQQHGVTPDRVTFLCMLKACISTGSITQAMVIHEDVIRCELESDVMVGNSIVHMYVKFGSLEAAHNVFDRLPVQTVVSWSALIVGHVEHQNGFVALRLFERMEQEHVRPNEVTFLYLLKACGSIGTTEAGRRLHDRIIREGLALDAVLGSAVVDMYASTGSMKESLTIFEKIPFQDCALWTAVISGHAQQGHYEHVLECFQSMQRHDVKLNAGVFASVLSACSNAGLVVEGWHYFHEMKKHSLVPGVEHYSCMIYLLARMGCLNNAAHLIASMPFSPDVTVWTSLLTSCNTYHSFDIGRYCFDRGIDLDRNADTSLNVLALNICSFDQ